ncbi:MAG TPA: hypothetical protein VHM90_20360 [Phycisphaerae bacterium]|nr:hypothetical protein [Phycisphaerae bacterium]
MGLALVLVLAGCGVPRSAGRFALRQEGLAAGVADDDASFGRRWRGRRTRGFRWSNSCGSGSPAARR